LTAKIGKPEFALGEYQPLADYQPSADFAQSADINLRLTIRLWLIGSADFDGLVGKIPADRKTKQNSSNFVSCFV
jgi:hypothetical protein